MRASADVGIKDDRGQSIVEVALLLPVVVWALIGGADLARAYAHQLAVENGARAGAEAAAVDYGTPTAAKVIAAARDEMSRTPGMSGTAPAVTVSFLKENGTSCSNAPTAADPCFAIVHITHTFRTIVAWPLVPNAALFDRTTKIRMIKAVHCGTGKAQSNKDCTGHSHGSQTHH